MKIDLPSEWPLGIKFECSSEGYVFAQVSAEDPPSPLHHGNLVRILEAWDTIWAVFRKTVPALMERCCQDPPDWGRIERLWMELPDGPLDEGCEWGFGVEFEAAPTVWYLPFYGLEPSVDEAVASW